MLQAYKTSFKSFHEEITKFSEDVQKHLEKRFKRKDEKDHASWNDILVEWYEENREDPWPGVVSALESYIGSVDDIIKEIKEEKLFMCNHIDQQTMINTVHTSCILRNYNGSVDDIVKKTKQQNKPRM